MKNRLLIITGPTASGKTALSVEIAKSFSGEIVSADSMQIYRELNIGTAKPTIEERGGIPHHMLDIVGIKEDYSVAQYLDDSRRIIADIHERGRLPIVVGGTGLYISMLADHVDMTAIPSDPSLREKLGLRVQTEGAMKLLEELRAVDPETADKLNEGNVRRIVIALEAYLLTGTPISELRRRSRERENPYELAMIALGCADREYLYRRIDTRVDMMISAGLLDEAKSVYGRCGRTASQAIGYKELFSHFDGEISLSEAVELIKRGSRNYAKRQLTWFRRDERIKWLNIDTLTNNEIFINTKKILETLK